MDELELEFPVLADPELKMIDAFGMAHREAMPGRNGARPGFLFIRSDGTVADERYPETYRDTVTAERMMAGFYLAAGR